MKMSRSSLSPSAALLTVAACMATAAAASAAESNQPTSAEHINQSTADATKELQCRQQIECRIRSAKQMLGNRQTAKELDAEHAGQMRLELQRIGERLDDFAQRHRRISLAESWHANRALDRWLYKLYLQSVGLDATADSAKPQQQLAMKQATPHKDSQNRRRLVVNR